MVWFGCALEGESEDEKEVKEGKKDESKKNLSNEEKEGSKGCVQLGFFAFGHSGCV